MPKCIDDVFLTPAEPIDRKKVYDWLLSWNNEIVYDKIPNYSDMCAEEDNYFYNGSSPAKGMYFIIKDGKEEVGCISYTCFHLNSGVAELDIWLKNESVCGKGFGYKAIKLLLKKLSTEIGIETVLIRPSKKNLRAISVYRKCGFSEMQSDISAYIKPEFLDKYGNGDCGFDGTENMIMLLNQHNL